MKTHHHRQVLAIGIATWACVVVGTGLSWALESSGPLRVDAEAAAAYDFTEVRTLLHGAVEAGRVPGASLILVHDGTVIFKEASGIADIDSGKPFTVDSLCHLASATKWMTGATILEVDEEGRPLLLGDGGVFGTFGWIDLKAGLVGVYLTQMRITSHYDLFVEGIPEAARAMAAAAH